MQLSSQREDTEEIRYGELQIAVGEIAVFKDVALGTKDDSRIWLNGLQRGIFKLMHVDKDFASLKGVASGSNLLNSTLSVPVALLNSKYFTKQDSYVDPLALPPQTEGGW